MGQRGGPYENEFWLVSNAKMLQAVRVEKVDGKIGGICLVSMFPSWVMDRNLPKIVHFSQFYNDLSKKSSSVKTIYIYAYESSH